MYLSTNTELFTDNFKAVFVDGQGQEEKFDVHIQNYFKGHVVGKHPFEIQVLQCEHFKTLESESIHFVILR